MAKIYTHTIHKRGCVHLTKIKHTVLKQSASDPLHCNKY